MLQYQHHLVAIWNMKGREGGRKKGEREREKNMKKLVMHAP